MTNSEIQVLELPGFIDDAEDGWVFDTLKTVLSASIREMQPLFPLSLSQYRNGTSFFGFNTWDEETLINVIISGCDSSTINYSQLILENFTKTTLRLAIVQDERLSQKIFSLLISVPFHRWTIPGTFEENFRNLKPVAWHLPEEWEQWKVAIECLRREGSYRTKNYDSRQIIGDKAIVVTRPRQMSKERRRKWQREPFTDAGVKFVERDEHIWWAWPGEGKSGSSDVTNPDNTLVEPTVRPDDNVTEERSYGLRAAGHTEELSGGQMENGGGLTDREYREDNRDWRSDVFFWIVGGNCPC